MKIATSIRPTSEEFKANYQYNLASTQAVDELAATAELGGGVQAQESQRKKGKLNARDRIAALIDQGSEFLELSKLAGHELYADAVPSGGIVTGIGQVKGRPCVIVANDQTVKGGTYYPITVKKHLRAQEIAEKNHLPCLYLVDSGGAFLPLQAEVFPDKDDFGRIFYNQARMSAKGIAQLSSVHGFCTAGGAYIPAMSDQSVIVKGTGSIFLAGPPLVKAATGEEVSVEELGGAKVHTSISGVSDHLAEDDMHAVSILREIVEHLGQRESQKTQTKLRESVDPAYDPDEILGVLPKELNKFFDVRELIARLVDGSNLFEFKKNYATTLVTGFAYLGGMPVGVIGNNGVLFSESALKGTHFIQLCCQENIPLLFLQNITGFMVGKTYEHGGIAKDGAKLVHAVANATVPKISLVVGGSFGAGNYGMCGRAYDPNFMFMWPRSRISVMGGPQAADVMATVKKQQLEKQGKQLDPELENKMRASILAEYETQGHALYSTARLWDDGVFDPRLTRKRLSMALAASLHCRPEQSRFGIFRM